jgi:hypothetical protein
MSATHRMILDSLRTIVIWGVSLMVGWQSFNYLQLVSAFITLLLILLVQLFEESINQRLDLHCFGLCNCNWDSHNHFFLLLKSMVSTIKPIRVQF